MKLTSEQIFNRERFEAWLVGQPGERRFNYGDCERCVVGSFIRETFGLSWVVVGDVSVSVGTGAFHAAEITLPEWLYKLLSEAREPLVPIPITNLITAYNRQFNCDLLAMDSTPLSLPSTQKNYANEA